MSVSSTLIQLVDEEDNPVRGGTMDEAQLEGHWHRIARVMVFDTKTKKFLLQKVRPNPYYNGGQWNTTSSGHVDAGEDYIDAAVRETKEEMGISLVGLYEIDRYATENKKQRAGKDRIYRRHNVTFLSMISADEVVLRPDETEVESILWLGMDELVKMRANEPESLTEGLPRFVDKERDNPKWQ